MASLPGHIVRELRSWQAEADALKKEVKVGCLSVVLLYYFILPLI